MEIEKSESQNGVSLFVSGRIDTKTSPEFEEIIDDVLSDDLPEEFKLVLDLKDVDYVSSAGLRTILYAQKKVNNLKSAKMVVRNVNSTVMEILDMTGFTEFLTVESNNC